VPFVWNGLKSGSDKPPAAPQVAAAQIAQQTSPTTQAVKPVIAVDDAFIKEVAALPAAQQVQRVAAKLKELNPGFDGLVTADH